MIRFLLLICGSGGLLSIGLTVSAQEIFPHSHDVVEIESAPIINRIPVKMRQIRRLFEQPDGALLVAEWETGSLIRLTPGEGVEQIAVGLNQPSGVVTAGTGEIYVTEFANGMAGAGSLIRIDPMGELSRVLTQLNGPSDLAISPQGELTFCEYQSGQVVQLNAVGEPRVLWEEIPAPTSLMFDSAGSLYVASRTEGSLYRRSFDGTVERIITGLQHPSDLQLDREGLVIILNSQTGLLTAWNPMTQKDRPYARVPAETTSLCFDADNNFIVGHWNYDFLMHIMRHLTIPCPHCEERIPLHLIPAVSPAGSEAEL